MRAFLAVAAFVAAAVPATLALAEDPPVVTAPPSVVTAPTDYCNVVIVVDGPVGTNGALGPGSTVFAPCGAEVSIPSVFDQPATVAADPAFAPAVAGRIGYVPTWVLLALG